MNAWNRFCGVNFLACFIAGCAQNIQQHSEAYSPLSELKVSIEIDALREEIAIAQAALSKLTNSFAANQKGKKVERGRDARERFYNSKARYQDLRTELEILRRRAGALRAERNEYEKDLLLHR